MKKELLEKYIEKLSKNDIVIYLKKELIPATNEEIDLIYKEIKTKYEEILNTDFIKYIENYKNKLNAKLYQKILEKYNEYKKFIE